MPELSIGNQTGASMVEYAFLLAGIAVVVAVSLPLFADAVTDLFSRPLPFLP